MYWLYNFLYPEVFTGTVNHPMLLHILFLVLFEIIFRFQFCLLIEVFPSHWWYPVVKYCNENKVQFFSCFDQGRPSALTVALQPSV